MAALLVALVMPWRGAALAAGPSFDCTAAKAPIEILICGSDDLARADADLADLYRRLQGALQGSARADLLSQQRSWLKSRIAACGIPAANGAKPADAAKATACLLALYHDRFGALAGLAAGAPAQAAPASQPSVDQQTAPQTPPASPPAADQQAAPQTAPAAPASVPAATPILPPAPQLAATSFPATGEQNTILSVAQFGRYSVAVKSAQGVALQLVDRMTGPSETAGSAGSEDGRIDRFLDRGQYKILLHASDKGSGQAVLTVHPFAELNGAEVPRLPDLKPIDTTLDDFQQRSYWLQIDQRRVVAIEAAGRNLADMRLWRDGNWLVDAAPTEAEIEPEPGKPLEVRRIVTTLEPGLYLLSAYGGPEATWAKTSDQHPLHLRLGIPTLTDAARQTLIASPFGIDRFLVPASANFFRLELPEAEAAQLSVGTYDEAKPFDLGDQANITKKTLPPVAEIGDDSADTGTKLVTITRQAGKPYVLQYFQSVSEYQFKGSGDYWISTLHSGYGEDDIDATGLLTKAGTDNPERIIGSNAPKLAAGAAWSRRFNLLDSATAFFNVTQAGVYVIDGSGAAAEYRFEPMVNFPPNYQAPDFQPAGYRWQLEPGYYVMTAQPKNNGKGILTIKVSALGATSSGDQAKETSVSFPRIHLDDGFHYTLYLNQQPGVSAGVVLRSLPIDLERGLPVVLKAGASIDIPVTAPGNGTVTAVGEDGKPLEFTIDHNARVTRWRGSGGQHILTLKNATAKAFNCALRFLPDSLAPETPLPAVPADALQAIPNFPALAPQAPSYFDIATDEQHTFALDVAEPGLYRVESTGLLQTEGAIRTRTVVALDKEANNGTGRNFLIQQYLGQGAYQLSVASQGKTKGHLGVSVAQTTLMDGGALSLGVPARDTIAAGDGLLYTFSIAAPGRYHLQALGLGRTYAMRLEDADGWPIIAPNAPADYTERFAAGTYRLVILPQPVDAKIVTLLERIEEPAKIDGRGPHDLALDQPQDYQWLEPEAGAERVPDQWRFRLPAPAHVAIDLSRSMTADLVAEADGTTRGQVNGGETWKGELPAGSYVLRATTIEPNNRFDYTVTVAATELLAGESRAAKLPADIPLSLGGDAVVEIGSFGTVDTRAWLYDDKGRLVATNDDRPNDWNFAISGRRRPGTYRLHVEMVGSGGAVAAAKNLKAAGDQSGNDQSNGDQSNGDQSSDDQSSGDQSSGDQSGGDQSGGDQPGDQQSQGDQAAADQADSGNGSAITPPSDTTTVSIYQAEEQQETALDAGGDASLSGPKVHLVPLNAAPGDLLIASADGNGPAVGIGIEIKEQDQWRTLGEASGRAPWLAVPAQGIADTYRLRVWSVDRSTLPIRLQTRMVSPPRGQTADFIGAGGVRLQPVPGVTPPLGVAAVGVDAAGAFRLQHPLPDLAWSTAAGRALAGDSAGIVFGNPGTFWFGARLLEGSGSVVAQPVIPGENPVVLTVPGSDRAPTIIADPVATQGQPQLWLVDSRLGQPGIGGEGLVSAAAMNSGVAVAPDATQTGFALRLRNAGDPAAPLPVTLRRIGFAAPAAEALNWGIADRAIRSHQALALTLPKGLKRMNFALPPQTAVLLQGEGQDDEAIWSGGSALALNEDSSADRLLVLAAAATDGEIGIGLAPIGAEDATAALGGGRIFKQYFAAAGVIRLHVHLSDNERKAGASLRLMLAGAVQQSTLQRDDGTVSRDAAPSLTGDAKVDIAHGAGPVVAWLDGGDPLTSLGVAATATQLSATAVVRLAGDAQQIVFAVDAPKFLHLKTTTPVIAQLKPAEGAQLLKVFADGADLNLLLPKGTTPVVLRAAGAGPLAGLAEAALVDIAPIGEGLGPKVRLAPGESRLYSFAVKDERDIGIGVRGSVDSAHCRVLDADGGEVGAGVVQMLHLKAGTYLLAVDAPSDGNAIEVQPALVGVAAPDGSPPDEVKRFYLELAGLKPK